MSYLGTFLFVCVAIRYWAQVVDEVYWRRILTDRISDCRDELRAGWTRSKRVEAAIVATLFTVGAVAFLADQVW